MTKSIEAIGRAAAKELVNAGYFRFDEHDDAEYRGVVAGTAAEIITDTLRDSAYTGDNIEELSEQIHKVYCAYYLAREGKPYWTEGNYSKLDEATKEADRYMARFILDRERAGDLYRSGVEDARAVAKKFSNQAYENYQDSPTQNSLYSIRQDIAEAIAVEIAALNPTPSDKETR